MLKQGLERIGFHVEEAKDELAAACLMLRPDVPSLALLAFDTMLAKFPEVCEALRRAKEDVLIAALIPESRTREIGLALEAGADDFLLIPGTTHELEGRLRILQRRVAHRASTAHRTAEADQAAASDGAPAEPVPALAAVPVEAMASSEAEPAGDAAPPRADEPPTLRPVALPDAPAAATPPDEADATPAADQEPPSNAEPIPAATDDPERSSATPTAEESTVALPAALTDETAPQTSESPAVGDDAPALSREPDPDAPSDLELLRLLRIQEAFARSFRELQLTPVRELDVRHAAELPHYSAWTYLVARIGPTAYWCTLRLDADRDPAEALAGRIATRTLHAQVQPTVLLKQILTLTQEMLLSRQDPEDGLQLYLPYEPVAMTTRALPANLSSTRAARQSYGLIVQDDVPVRLGVTVQQGPIEDRRLVQLRRFDLLAAPLKTADEKMLLRDGVMLDTTYIDKIQTVAHHRAVDATALVFRPPGGLAVFLHRLA